MALTQNEFDFLSELTTTIVLETLNQQLKDSNTGMGVTSGYSPVANNKALEVISGASAPCNNIVAVPSSDDGVGLLDEALRCVLWLDRAGLTDDFIRRYRYPLYYYGVETARLILAQYDGNTLGIGSNGRNQAPALTSCGQTSSNAYAAHPLPSPQTPSNAYSNSPFSKNQAFPSPPPPTPQTFPGGPPTYSIPSASQVKYFVNILSQLLEETCPNRTDPNLVTKEDGILASLQQAVVECLKNVRQKRLVGAGVQEVAYGVTQQYCPRTVGISPTVMMCTVQQQTSEPQYRRAEEKSTNFPELPPRKRKEAKLSKETTQDIFDILDKEGRKYGKDENNNLIIEAGSAKQDECTKNIGFVGDLEILNSSLRCNKSSTKISSLPRKVDSSCSLGGGDVEDNKEEEEEEEEEEELSSEEPNATKSSSKYTQKLKPILVDEATPAKQGPCKVTFNMSPGTHTASSGSGDTNNRPADVVQSSSQFLPNCPCPAAALFGCFNRGFVDTSSRFDSTLYNDRDFLKSWVMHVLANSCQGQCGKTASECQEHTLKYLMGLVSSWRSLYARKSNGQFQFMDSDHLLNTFQQLK